jgi:hypothetical protein
VKITFELLDNKPDLIAYLWRQNPFSELPMTNVGGRKFSRTITGQTLGSTINYAVKFAFAGGLAVTRYVPYVVGSNCATMVNGPEELGFSIFPNPSDGKVYVTGLQNKNCEFSLMDLTGRNLATGILPSEGSFLDVSHCKDGIYILNLKSGTSHFYRKLVVRR